MGNKGSFKKGQIPWNKDKKDIHLSPDTEFKVGPEHTGDKHPAWKGGVQHMTNDCTHLYDGPNKRVRRPRKVYEDTFGPIPEGYIIIHKDNDKDNDEPWNLKAISRAENLNRNLKR